MPVPPEVRFAQYNSDRRHYTPPERLRKSEYRFSGKETRQAYPGMRRIIRGSKRKLQDLFCRKLYDFRRVNASSAGMETGAVITRSGGLFRF